MPAYVIFYVEIRDAEKFHAFMTGVKPAIQQAGTRVDKGFKGPILIRERGGLLKRVKGFQVKELHKRRTTEGLRKAENG